MGGQAGTGETLTAQQYVDLALARPGDALKEISQGLARDWPSEAERSMVLRASAIAHRILGYADEARSALAEAIEISSGIDEPRVHALNLLTRAGDIARDGQTHEALSVLNEIEPLLDGDDRTEVLLQRAQVHMWGARFRDADADLTEALRRVDPVTKPGWKAEALLCRGPVRAYLGHRQSAIDDLQKSMHVFAAADDPIGVGQARWNLAIALLTNGEPAQAELTFAKATEELKACDFPVDQFLADRCEALDALGLYQESITLAEAGAEALDQAGWGLDAAVLNLALAHSLQLAGHLTAALNRTEAATSMFQAYGQEDWSVLARLRSLDLRLAHAEPGAAAEMAKEAADMARQCRARGQEVWRTDALLTQAAAEVAAERPADARTTLTKVGRRFRQVHQDIRRVRLHATLARADGDDAHVLRCCRRGVRILHAASASLGPSVVRSSMTRQVEPLVNLGLTTLLTNGRWRDALQLLEDTTRHSLPPRRHSTAALHAEYRGLTATIIEEGKKLRDTAALRKRRRELEHEIRADRTRHREDGTLVPEVVLSPAHILRYVVAEDDLWLLQRKRNRTTARRLGPLGEVNKAIDELNYSVRQTFKKSDPLSRVDLLAEQVDKVLGHPGEASTSDILNVITHPRLNSFPLGVLPSLHEVQWVQASSARLAPPMRPLPNRFRAGAIAGKDLAGASVEATLVAGHYPNAAVLQDSEATSAATRELMGTCDVIHIAAHADIKAGNPMFSSISLSDGEFTLFEFADIDRAPVVAVVASCDSTSSTAIGTSPVGVAQALLEAGVRSVVGAGCEIPTDDDIVHVMTRLHGLGVAHSPTVARTELTQLAELSPRQRLIARCLTVATLFPIIDGSVTDAPSR